MNMKLWTTAEFSTRFTFLVCILEDTTSDFSCDTEWSDGGFSWNL